MKEIIGKSKLTLVLPLLKIVAEEHNLNLCYSKDFKKARTILEERYIIKKWC
jgi:hypothetical protein